MEVSVRLVSTQGLGLVEGRGAQRSPIVEVLAGEAIEEDEILQTSGLAGSLYPPGIPIGRVVSVPDRAATGAGDPDEDDDTTDTTTGGATVIPELAPVGTVRAVIEPYARLDQLNFVTVLVWQPAS
jgi:cell shape-determining protein MreC